MSDYENSPSAKLLATNCCACGKPLVDAVSVECGVGPDCRKKYLVAAGDVPEAARERANALVHAVACRPGDGLFALNAAAELLAVGFHLLAQRLVERTADIVIAPIDGGRISVVSPYDEVAVGALRGIRGRRWDKDAKVNTFPVGERKAVWQVLEAHYPGRLGMGPKGPFVIGAKAT